jgi:LacI family transcriptional regulator
MPRGARRVHPVTMADVATRAGVSMATASRVLNQAPNVSERTRARVLTAVEALGYKVDLRGRSLATGRSNIVGLLCGNLDDPDDLSLVRAILDEAVTSGLRVLVAESRGVATRREGAVARWLDEGVDAIILLPERSHGGDDEQLTTRLAQFIRRGGQVVHVETQDRIVTGSLLLLEEHDAAADLGEALARRGHRRFAVVAPQSHELGGIRAKGFEAGVRRMHGEGASFKLEVHADVAGVAGVRTWWSRQREPVDCVFAVTVPLAQSVTTELSWLGVSVPDDVSVATFGYTGQDIPVSTVAAMMPAGSAAARALQLAGDDGNDAMRVVGGLRHQLTAASTRRRDTGPPALGSCGSESHLALGSG